MALSCPRFRWSAQKVGEINDDPRQVPIYLDRREGSLKSSEQTISNVPYDISVRKVQFIRTETLPHWIGFGSDVGTAMTQLWNSLRPSLYQLFIGSHPSDYAINICSSYSGIIGHFCQHGNIVSVFFSDLFNGAYFGYYIIAYFVCFLVQHRS